MSERAKKTLGLGALVMAGAALLLFLVVLISPRTVQTASAQAQQQAPPQNSASPGNGIPNNGVNASSLVWLMRAGYQPDVLAAGGASNATAVAALNLLAAHQDELNSLSVMEHDRDTKAEQLAHVQDRLWRGGASPDRLTALQAASGQLEARQIEVDHAEAQLDTSLAEFLVGTVGAEGVAVSDRFRANRDRRVPDVFKALDLDEDAWSTLESAYAKATHNYTLSDDEASLLAQCESHPISILVASRLTNDAPGIELVYDQAIAQEAQEAQE